MTFPAEESGANAAILHDMGWIEIGAAGYLTSNAAITESEEQELHDCVEDLALVFFPKAVITAMFDSVRIMIDAQPWHSSIPTAVFYRDYAVLRQYCPECENAVFESKHSHVRVVELMLEDINRNYSDILCNTCSVEGKTARRKWLSSAVGLDPLREERAEHIV